MALRLLSKAYWRGTQIRFRRPVPDAVGEPVMIDAADNARLHGIWWTSKKNPRPNVAVIAAHPRVDFTEHHTFPYLLDAGYGCLGANLRSLNNDADCLHEKLLVDVAAYMNWLKARGVAKIVLLGNSGGGSLFSFYQSEAVKKPGDRIQRTPGGQPVLLDKIDMPPGDGVVFMAAHAGQGLVLNEVIDPAATDEADPMKTDLSLDMYNPANGFAPPPQWSRYAPEFVARFRAAQIARVRRIDNCAREWIADAADAARAHDDAEFVNLPPARQRGILQREAFEPIMVVYRTMANLHYTDNSIDPSPRGYGSLLSPRPDLMNFQRLGFARVVTPQGWLSTWSGLSSNANINKTGPAISVPAVVVNAGRDLDVYPETHSKLIYATIRSADKEYWNFDDALHYFQPDENETGDAALDALMAKLVPWFKKRFPL